MMGRSGAFTMDPLSEEVLYSAEDKRRVIYCVDLDASENERKLLLLDTIHIYKSQ
jgi:hypothetical protein